MPNTIDGVPFLFDDSSDSQLFGQLFPEGLSPPNIRGNFGATANPNPYQSPLGEESLFHSFVDIEEGFTQSIDTSDGYTYKLFPLVSGVEVFERYNSQAPEDTPSSKQLFIYYEKGDDTSLDFFGTACRVKFGTERKLLMQKLENRKTVVRLGDRDVHTLSEWSSVVAKRLKIETDVLLSAVKLELSGLLNDKTVFKYLLGLNNDLAKWIYGGVGKMEEWKFTEKNYEYAKWRAGTQKEYEPIIPVFFETRGKDFLTTNNRDTNKVKDKGFDNLVSFVNDFDNILFNPQAITQVIPGVADDAIVLFARAFYQDKLPANVRRLLTKVKGIVNQAKIFINTIKNEINNSTALFNALLCGIINGLISLLQLVVLIIGYIIDNFAILELEKPFSREEFDKSEQRLEFVEDLIETLSERSEKIFNGLLLNLITANAQFIALVDSIYKKLKNVSRYFIAFIIGVIIFEVVFDIILAFFTGGTSLAVTLANKISRASAKAAQAGIKVAKQVGKKVTTSTTDILRFLRAEFDELIQAIVNGKFLKYIEDKLDDILGLVKKNTKGFIDDLGTSKEVDELFRNKGVNKADGGIKLSRNQLQKLKRNLESRYKEFGLKIEIVNKSPKFRARLKKWNGRRNTQGSFNPGPPPVIYVRQNSTQLTLQHEVWHMDDLKRLGNVEYKRVANWKHEESVWNKIFGTRNKWTDEELVDSYWYYKRTAFNEGSTPNIIKEMEELIKLFPNRIKN